jgi:hypothetical protein
MQEASAGVPCGHTVASDLRSEERELGAGSGETDKFTRRSAERWRCRARQTDARFRERLRWTKKELEEPLSTVGRYIGLSREGDDE